MLQVWVGCWFRLDVFANVISHPQEKEKVSSRNRRCWFVYASLTSAVEKGWADTNYPGPTMLYVFFGLVWFLCSKAIYRLYKLARSDHGQVTLQLTVFAIWCEDGLPLLGAGKHFPPPPEPALGGPCCYFALTVGVSAPPEEITFYLRLAYTGLASRLSCDLEFQVRWSQV